MPEFGEILAELRQDKGMTQQDLAVMLNVSKSSISNYETGQRRAHTELICKVAKVFNVSADYLLGFSDYRIPLSIIEGKYSDGRTVGEVLELILTLDSDRRHILCALLNDMRFGMKETERE